MHAATLTARLLPGAITCSLLLAACSPPAAAPNLHTAPMRPQVVETFASLVVTLTRAQAYALADVSGLSWDSVEMTLENESGLLAAPGRLTNAVSQTGATVTTAFNRLKPGAGYTLAVYLKNGGQLVGSSKSAVFTLNAGANPMDLTIAKQGAVTFGAVSANANSAGNATDGTDVVLGDAVTILTGIPTATDSGIAHIKGYAIGTGAMPAVGATETLLTHSETNVPAEFGEFTWQTATAASWVSGAWVYTALNPASLVGGALGGTTPATADVYFKLYDANDTYLGRTEALHVRVFQPGKLDVRVQ